MGIEPPTGEVRRHRRVVHAFMAATLTLSLASCGGGGGGEPGPSETVAFEGFSFRIADDVTLTTPPTEQLGSGTLSLGAPLNTVIVFRFDGVPEGPFNSATLPVYTTSAWITPDIPTVPGTTIHAKGAYVAVGKTVEFRPFVPTAPITLSLSAEPAGVPGLFPASTYAVEVSTTAGSSIGNLIGDGGSATFDTTSVAAAYYPPSVDPFGAPKLVSATGSVVSTGIHDETPYNFAPTVGSGDATIELTYDRALMPTATNLEGSDVDGDGWVEPTWTLRSPSSAILVGHVVPAGSSLGNGTEFAALSALTPDSSPQANGADIVFGEDTPAPWSVPLSMTFDRSGALLFALLEAEEPSAPQRLTVIDHATGDATHARLANEPVGLGGITLTGLTTTANGAVLGVDRSERRIVELKPTVRRTLPHGTPVLEALSVGPEGGAFAGSPWPTKHDVIDLISTASGDIWALVSDGNGLPQRLVMTTGFDLAANGTPKSDACWPTNDTVLDGLSQGVVDVEYESVTSVLALDVDLDAIVRIDLLDGHVTPLVMDVASFGATPSNGARCLARATAHFDVNVTVLANESEHALVELRPRGMLPIGAPVDVMQALALTSLLGANDINTPSAAPRHRLGRKRVHTVTTAATTSSPDTPIHDVFLESFDDTQWLDAMPPDLTTMALWADALPDGSPSSALQALGGPTVPESLGDFRPLPSPLFDSALEFSNDPEMLAEANLKYIYLDTASQSFPLVGGATPDITAATTIANGNFVFDDFVVPEGVILKIVGPNACNITATGDVLIEGVIDISGSDGLGDDTFDTGFYPVPGGTGGPGAGRGGNGHPTLWDTAGNGTQDQYVTPETGEQGYGPKVSPTGTITMSQIGGIGGLSTLGYDPDAQGYPRVPVQSTQLTAYNGNEHHRPPGGGGGSFGVVGRQAHEGTGAYLVQSNSTWYPFTRCQFDDGQRDALYGNEANAALGLLPSQPLQCVYLDGTIEAPNRKKPGGLPGERIFEDGDASNDYIGVGGELTVLIGGQGGGAGGSRVDSMDHQQWSIDKLGSPLPFGLPYPKLSLNGPKSPALYDAKGGAGGGGGGSIRIRAFGDIRVARTGRIDASGGDGGGGEIVQASSWAGGGGGGSGGAVILTAKGDIVLEADPDNRLPTVPDSNGARGATIDVSGGLGKDARTSPKYHTQKLPGSLHASRSDGGQGGFGIVQLKSGDGLPRIEQGAFVHARVRAMAKLGAWTDPLDKSKGSPFSKAGNDPSASDHPFDKAPNPKELWFYDLLHYRGFAYEDGGTRVPDLILNGTDPAIITAHPTIAPGSYQLDTPMMSYLGGRFVREPQPQFLFKTWYGIEDDAEIVVDPDGDGPLPAVPGTLYGAGDVVPLSIDLVEPAGTPITELVDGEERFVLDNLVPRLPLVHPNMLPLDLGFISEGRSRWLDFHGVTLRMRNANGRTPPFFSPVHGTHDSDGSGWLEGEVETSSPVPGSPALFVKNTPGAPFDPSLHVDGIPTQEPFNDIKLDAVEIGVDNAVSLAAQVRWLFQGAFGTRHGSSVPDPDTLTEWTGDLESISGYPLVRFRVVFDIDATSELINNDATFPRPVVDSLRLRMTY